MKIKIVNIELVTKLSGGEVELIASVTPAWLFPDRDMESLSKQIWIKGNTISTHWDSCH